MKKFLVAIAVLTSITAMTVNAQDAKKEPVKNETKKEQCDKKKECCKGDTTKKECCKDAAKKEVKKSDAKKKEVK